MAYRRLRRDLAGLRRLGNTQLGDSVDVAPYLVVQTNDSRMSDARTPTAHNILSVYHGDTTAGTVTAGDLIVGAAGSGSTWTRLPLGGSGELLRSTGGAVAWSGTNLTFDGTIFTVATHARVGTATDTATAGDFVAGLTGAARIFYDQSAATQFLYNSAGTVRFTFDAAAQMFTLSGRIDADVTRNDTSGTINGWDFDLLSGPSSASSASLRGVLSVLRTSGSQNFTGALEGFRGEISLQTTGTTSLAIGASYFTTNAAAATVSVIEGARFTIQNTNASGVITTARGLHIPAPTNSGTITTFNAIYIGDPTTVTTGNAILTEGGNVIFNNANGAYDFRISGDTLAYMFFCNGSAATLENIALLTTAEPNWQTMNRGLFIGDVTTAPTGNPASGFFHYSNAGVPTWRLSGGPIINLSQAAGGQNLTNNVTAGGVDGTIANYTDLLVYSNDAATIRNNIYQLARALKQDHDQLRAMGILT